MKHIFTFLLICSISYQAANAQATRFLVNPSFELPAKGCASFSVMPENEVPGWVSSDMTPNGRYECGVFGPNIITPIEIWGAGFQGVGSNTGAQFAEVNAYTNSGMYQSLCLLPNEVVTFSIWHRKQSNSAAITERLRVELVDPVSGSVISTAATTHDAVFGTWTLYSGTVTNNGTQGARRLGIFGSRLETATGLPGGLAQNSGNLIDDAAINLRPLVDIRAFSRSSVTEGSLNNSSNLELLVNGSIKAGSPGTVIIQKTGSATYGVDYTIGTPSRGSVSVDANGNITLTLPTGDYDPSTGTGTLAGLITIPFTIQADAPDNNEPLTYTITSVSGGGGGNPLLDLSANMGGFSAACGPVVGSANLTIFDPPLSGQLFNDANGQTDNNINGTPVLPPGGLFMILKDNMGNVVASVPVAANGSYSFSDVPDGNYTLQLSTTAGTVGQPAPAPSLPAGWANTAEGTTSTGDGSAGGTTTVTVVNGTPVTSVNFGIDQVPTAYPKTKTVTGTPAPGAAISLGDMPPAGSDPEDQPAQGTWSAKPVQINTLPGNGFILKYNGVAVTAGQTIPNFDASLLTIEATGSTPMGTASAGFTYSVIDAAGIASAPANYTVNFSIPLPVTLISFAATAATDGCTVNIKWETATAINLHHFDIEASKDGIQFYPLKQVQPQATGKYATTDRSTTGTLTYYRLKFTDNDGSFSYSDVSRVVTNCGTQKIVITPTVVSNQLRVNGLAGSEWISVVDAGGKTHIRRQATNTMEEINVSSLAKGIYLVQVSSNGQPLQMTRIVKQ